MKQNLAVDLIASSDQRVVVGLGATGLSCARYLASRGITFCVVDTRLSPPGLEAFKAEFPQIPLYLGDVPAAVLEHASQLIVSPGVALEEPVVTMAKAAGVAVMGDIDLFVRAAMAPVIGITGSNAKSTVTALVGEMARDAGINVGVGGNIGVPALDLLRGEHDLYVLELSSFQLERATQLNLAVATVLNVTADHLDRHGSMPRYHQAKHRIFQGCSKAVANRSDPLTTPLVVDTVPVIAWAMREPELGGFGLREYEGVEYFSFSFDLLMSVNEMTMKGRHNIANALAALAIGYAADLPIAGMLTTLKRFTGLPHRCQLVREINGVRFINDSKGTNVGATEAALAGLGGDKNIILIAGGQGKGADFTGLARSIAAHCKFVVLLGEARQQLSESIGDTVSTSIADSLEEAVAIAAQQASSGDCVLLSPACASFDMFSGYVQRGEIFSAAVNSLAEAAI